MNKKKKTQFTFKVNDEEAETVRKLREDYAINLSGSFKLFLKDYLRRLEKMEQ